MARPKVSARYLQKKIAVNYKNEVCEVFELAKKHGLQAKLVEVSREGPLHEGIFTFCLTVGDFTSVAQGPTRSKAKVLAAQQLLPDLRNLPLPFEEEEISNYGRRKTHKHNGLWKELPFYKPDEDPLEVLHKLLTIWRGEPPEVTVVDVDRESNPWIYFVQLVVAGDAVVGLGHNKMLAKRNAAAKLLNSFGYNFTYTEPKPTPREVLPDVNTAPEDENIPEAFLNAPDVILENEQEEECPVSQDNTAHSEEQMQPEADKPEMLPEEVTSPVEGPADLTQEDSSTPVQEVTAQYSVDMLQQLHPDLLPLLAEMGVIENSSGTVQWGKTSLQLQKQTSTDTEEVVSEDLPEIRDITKPDFIQGESSASETYEIEEEIQTPSFDLVPQEDTKSTSPDATEKHAEPAVNLGVLPAEILAQLAYMGVIEENDGIVGWSDPKETTTCEEESQDVCYSLQTLTKEDQTSIVPASVGCTEIFLEENTRFTTRPERSSEPSENISTPERNSDISEVISTVKKAEPSENICAVERNCSPTETSAIPTSTSPPVPYRVSFFITSALVRKIFKMAGSHDLHNAGLMTVSLHKSIHDQLENDGDGEIRLKHLDEMGKAAAKHLAVEYGSAEALLSAAREADTVFEAAVVKHLNSELRTFHQRPKSALLRFFSRLRRAFH